MKMDEFLQQHAVFTVEELDRFLSARGDRAIRTPAGRC